MQSATSCRMLSQLFQTSSQSPTQLRMSSDHHHNHHHNHNHQSEISSTKSRIVSCRRLSLKTYLLPLYCSVVIIAYLISAGPVGHCQQVANSSAPTNGSATTTIRSDIDNIVGPESNTTTPPTTAPELLLSGEEFVDSKEVPTLLFDGTSNEDDQEDTTNATSNSTTTTAPTTTPTATTTTTTTTVRGGQDETASAPGNMNDEEGSEDDQEGPTSGPLTFQPPQNISQYMDYIEKLFRDLRHQITDLFEPHLPQLIRTSQMVELSNSCSYDMLRMALALRQFEPWALRMIDSSGKVPEGIFEGSFTALGSYDECLSTVFQTPGASASTQQHQDTSPTPDNERPATSGSSVKQQVGSAGPTQGKYCLVTVSPFMPPKPPADKVERLFQEEANRRNYTRDDQFSRLSPMFYYMKFRIGVCIPSTCDQQDMDSISSALSSSLRLNITIPDCRVKQTDQPLTRHQLVAGLIFASVLVGVLVATLIDFFRLKWNQIAYQEVGFIQVASERKQYNLSAIARGHIDQREISIRMMPQQQQQQQPAQHPLALGQQLSENLEFVVNECTSLTAAAAAAEANGRRSDNNFNKRLSKHWSWMSFSFLTNFRLYFQTPATTKAAADKTATIGGGSAESGQRRPAANQMVACLNGIRVLSLCWVIVANSYLTLDPRATKRLTETREAPRDFLFQLVVQASLAVETFFFLSGLLTSLSFARRLQPAASSSSAASAAAAADQKLNSLPKSTTGGNVSLALKWLHFYVHRYVRMTPPTMLVIAFSMYAYHFGDGPLWFEATQRAHDSCTQNWWRHLLHVANFIDTRQMCFIHYWYIAADMQLFLFAPVIMLLLYKCRRLAYFLIASIGAFSIGQVFYTTYARSLPPTLLFYSTDPESRREFGNTIMTKPVTHALPYIVGMLVGWCFVLPSTTSGRRRHHQQRDEHEHKIPDGANYDDSPPLATTSRGSKFSLAGLFGSLALAIALVELFLPYKWNNSHLPSRLMASTYAALFRFGWSLVLAYVVVWCRHWRTRKCSQPVGCSGCYKKTNTTSTLLSAEGSPHLDQQQQPMSFISTPQAPAAAAAVAAHYRRRRRHHVQRPTLETEPEYCFCGSGGGYLNRLLGLNVFTHLSKLSFVAYLIHLPLMSVFIGQTRGLFAFSHTLVVHLAISYLVMSFVLAFLLVHVIEFPFITFERLLFARLFHLINRQTATYGHDWLAGEETKNSRTKSATMNQDCHLTDKERVLKLSIEPQRDQSSGAHHQRSHQHQHSAATPNHQLHRTATGAGLYHPHNQHHLPPAFTSERL